MNTEYIGRQLCSFSEIRVRKKLFLIFLQKGTKKDRVLRGVLARILVETASRIFTADN